MSHCTDTIKTQECTASTIECPETCPDDWTEEACSVTCGNGKRTETRIIGAGINADAFCDRVRTVDCQMEPCPVDCVLGDWMAEGEGKSLAVLESRFTSSQCCVIPITEAKLVG